MKNGFLRLHQSTQLDKQDRYKHIVTNASFTFLQIHCKRSNINTFMHNVEKWPNILYKYCGVNIASF